MSLTYWVVTSTIKGLARLLCRVHEDQLASVPERGPLILVINHINFLDAPVLYTHLQPRPLAGFAKVETWDHPALRLLADLWGAIPLHRGEADMAALRQGLQALDDGRILGVAPEGTRSGDGHLQRGSPGIVLLALRSGAALLPIGCSGAEHFWSNLKRLRRTDFSISVGQPFYLEAGGKKVNREVRQQMTDEIMYQVAALLPPANRGVYSDPAGATQAYLRFLPGRESLRHVYPSTTPKTRIPSAQSQPPMIASRKKEGPPTEMT
jgi:1-acyl-sn-glycerol-3-phosphate acyltransferase